MLRTVFGGQSTQGIFNKNLYSKIHHQTCLPFWSFCCFHICKMLLYILLDLYSRPVAFSLKTGVCRHSDASNGEFWDFASAPDNLVGFSSLTSTFSFYFWTKYWIFDKVVTFCNLPHQHVWGGVCVSDIKGPNYRWYIEIITPPRPPYISVLSSCGVVSGLGEPSCFEVYGQCFF